MNVFNVCQSVCVRVCSASIGRMLLAVLILSHVNTGDESAGAERPQLADSFTEPTMSPLS